MSKLDGSLGISRRDLFKGRTLLRCVEQQQLYSVF